MKKHLGKITNLSAFALIMVPVLVLAGGLEPLVPCDGTNCDFNSLLELVDNIMNYIVVMTIPISAIMFAYAGFLYLTSQGNVTKRQKAHHVFTYVGIGLFFVLAAFLIVKAILVGLGAKDTSFLDF